MERVPYFCRRYLQKMKIKIYKPQSGKIFNCKIINWITQNRDLFLNFGIDIKEDHSSFDFILIPTFYLDCRDEVSFKLSKEKSYKIIEGYQNIILTDENDNASLFGYKHLLSDNRVKYVLKNFLLDREEYKKPTIFGGIKHFQDSNHPSWTGYEFTDKEWSKIQYSGLDIGFYTTWNSPGRFNPSPQTYSNKYIDVFAIFQAVHKGRKFYNQEIGKYYTEHRLKCWDELHRVRRNIISGTTDIGLSNQLQSLSKITISPFGMGEFCYRDYEAIFNLSLVIKPDTQHVKTLINYFEPYKNYIPCKPDYSDVNEKIDLVLSNEDLRRDVVTYAFNSFHEKYKKETVVEHLKNNIFAK